MTKIEPIQSMVIGITNVPLRLGAFRTALRDVFTASGGDRPEVQDLAILITDGVPNREEDTYFDEVIKFRVISISCNYKGNMIPMFLLLSALSRPQFTDKLKH